MSRINRSLEDIIPSTGESVFFDHLELKDVLSFSSVCHDARRKYEAYIKIRFSIYKILDRYFVHAVSIEFRFLMRSTGAIISGSAALQLFDRSYYDKSDLDVFVNRRNVRLVTEWLIAHGYIFVLSDDQAELHATYEELVDQGEEFHHEDSFSSLGIDNFYDEFEVLNFLSKENGRKIQVVATTYCPLNAVLNFHSTAVLNVLTYSKAYCLYPKATLLERRTLQNCWHSPALHHEIVRKYTARGWSFLPSLPVDEVFVPSSSFSNGLRSLGDSRCWTLTFPPPYVSQNDLALFAKKYPFGGVNNDIEIDRWLAGTSGSRHFCHSAYILQSTRLSRAFLIPTYLHLDNIIKFLNELKRDTPDESRLDVFLPNLYLQ